MTVLDPETTASSLGGEGLGSFSRFMQSSLSSSSLPESERPTLLRDENPYTAFVNRRPDPKPTSFGPTSSGKGIEYMLPGGFREDLNKSRNWAELLSGLFYIGGACDIISTSMDI